MNDYKMGIRRMVIWSTVIIGAIGIAWGFTPQYRSWFAAILLGMVCGLIGTTYTAWIVHQIGQLATDDQGDQRRQPTFGAMARFGLAVLAAAISTKYPQHFYTPALAIGLMIPFVIAFIDMFHSNLSEGS